MGFLRRMLGGKSEGKKQPEAPAQRAATPGEMLDYLEQDRANAERVLLDHFRQCPACESNYLRVGAWTRRGAAGWTVSCVNCGEILEQTVEITTE